MRVEEMFGPVERDPSDLVMNAYRKLKQDSYWDTVDLFLRGRISTFESKSDNIHEHLKLVISVISRLQAGHSIEDIKEIDDWVDRIQSSPDPSQL